MTAPPRRGFSFPVQPAHVGIYALKAPLAHSCLGAWPRLPLAPRARSRPICASLPSVPARPRSRKRVRARPQLCGRTGCTPRLTVSTAPPQSSPSRPVAAGGLRPAQPRPPCLAVGAGWAAPAGAEIVLPMPRPLTGCRAEGCRITAMGARWVLGSAHRPALYLRPAPRQGQAAARSLSCPGPPQRWPHAARPALPPARVGICSGREGNDW